MTTQTHALEGKPEVPRGSVPSENVPGAALPLLTAGSRHPPHPRHPRPSGLDASPRHSPFLAVSISSSVQRELSFISMEAGKGHSTCWQRHQGAPSPSLLHGAPASL